MLAGKPTHKLTQKGLKIATLYDIEILWNEIVQLDQVVISAIRL